MCECQDMSMDVKTPRNVYLSAFYKRSFAYHTIKNRLPTILTQIIDSLSRNKDAIASQYGEEASDEIKLVIGDISKLKYEIQTNKPLENLTVDDPDVHLYNDYITRQASEEGHTKFFNTIWLLSECYMYRRLKQIFSLRTSLKDFDYFKSFKTEAYEKSLPLVTSLTNYLMNIKGEHFSPKVEFKNLLMVNLWGNKCDLSISTGTVGSHGQLYETEPLLEYVLSDHSEQIWQTVSAPVSNANNIVDIVLDNSGYELFTDCCVADFILNHNLANKVRFYVKAIPWFLSDVTKSDFLWTLQELQNSSDANLQKLGTRWEEFVSEGKWEIVINTFWTLPFEFKFMKKYEPTLYKMLSDAKLIIFKGDLNYRKLFGELNWDPTTSVEEALQGFHPSKLCVLRTIKADIVVGLKPGVAEKWEKADPHWMEKGDFGVIQFCEKVVKI